MTKKQPAIENDLADALACVMVRLKLNATDAVVVLAAFAEIASAVTATRDLEKRLARIERQLKAARS